jgi:hypothetical protein
MMRAQASMNPLENQTCELSTSILLVEQSTNLHAVMTLVATVGLDGEEFRFIIMLMACN